MENYHSNIYLTFDLEPFLILKIFSLEDTGDEKQPCLQTMQSMVSLFFKIFSQESIKQILSISSYISSYTLALTAIRH